MRLGPQEVDAADLESKPYAEHDEISPRDVVEADGIDECAFQRV